MKVVLKPTVYDRIVQDMVAAQRDRRSADYIVVSHDEYAELRKDQRCLDSLQYECHYSPSEFMSAKVTRSSHSFPLVADLPWRRESCPHINVVTHEKFRGVPLYVVPEDYCPR